MDNAPAPSRGTQDITVVWVVFVLAVLGLVAAYWFLLLKPKNEEISATQASIRTKESTFNTYKTEAEELLNYEDKFAALVHQWNKNQHFFVNGLVYDESTNTYKEQYKGREQWAIFDTLHQVWNAGAFANVLITEMWISEGLEFYMDDDPFEIPDELKTAVEWHASLLNRGENPNPLFTSHNFAIKFFGNLESIRRFIEVIQKLEGQDLKIFSIHCFENAGSPMYRANLIGLGDVILTDVSFEIDMAMSVYELNPKAATVNTPPDIPGSASCSYGSSGGGGGRGGRGGGGRGSGGGMGLGI
jgi:uncharacterized membrane protein YgcG